jgi:DNA polymerase I-like protein with 3'-5' exonuclease and polymerase domains
VAESPFLSNISGQLDNHQSWHIDLEKVVREFFRNKKALNMHMAQLEGRFTYAVRCQIEKPSAKESKCCADLFIPELLEYAIPEKPIMVFALGPTVVKTLGIRFRKYAAIQGQFIPAKVGGREALVFASLSKRQMVAKTGYIEILKQHIQVFLEGVLDSLQGRAVQVRPPLEELTKNYVFPKTLVHLERVIDEILSYAEPGKNPDNNIIALDTETNTKFPHRKKLKLLSISAAWAPGRSMSVLVEHPGAPWTLEEIRPHLSRLLLSPQPKVFHNGQYDLKVLAKKKLHVRKFSWDTMAAEHLLAEDKRGFYGLKILTKTMAPQYAGYEEQVQDIVHGEEAQSLSKQLKSEAEQPKLKGAAKKMAEDEGFASVPIDKLLVYGAIDPDVTRIICGKQRERMAFENRTYRKAQQDLMRSPKFVEHGQARTSLPEPLSHMMFNHVVPAIRVLASMESYGIAVDRDYLDTLAIQMDQSMALSSAKLMTMIAPHTLPAGEDFNPNSTAHLRKVLFGAGFLHPDTGRAVSYAGQVTPVLTKTNQISTNAAFLRSLVTQQDCPFSRELLQYRAMAKARNTFIENIRTLSAEDGRMHSSFHITGTGTGRLSSSDENMQNIPEFIGKHNIKKAFIPTDPATQVICNADAKAAEVRVYAAYSQDPNLIQALNDGLDPHSYFSSVGYKPETVLAGVPEEFYESTLALIGIDSLHAWSYDDFEKADFLIGSTEAPGPDPSYGKRLTKLRKNMKRVVFGILYGAGKRKVAEIVGISLEQAQTIIDILFRMFPTIPKYIDLTHEQIDHLGIIETFFGRRRRLDLKGLTPSLRSSAYRKGVNFNIQSTSSDIVMSVLCDIDQAIKDLGGRMLITVHDSLVFEVDKKYVSQLPDLINEYGVKRVAQRYPWLPVPFKWDIKVGPSYGETMLIPKYLKDHTPVITQADQDAFIEHEIRSEFEELAK